MTIPQPPETLDPTEGGTQRRVDTRGLSLRQFVAHGVIINSLFDVGIGLISLLRGVVLAVLLTRADLGLWGILLISLGVLARLKVIGISDKYVQQSEPDQELAFQHAFTLEMASSLATLVLLIAAVPLIAVVYGDWRLFAPGMVMSTMLVAYALQSPQWIHYRQMHFTTQRLQTTVEPVVGLAVAVALALAGAGYWSLVIGAWVGAWAGALVAVRMSPYPLRWRLDRASASVYWTFSRPILLATGASVVLANGVTLVTNFHLGLAAVGALTLASTLVSFTTKVDDTISTTIYPTICAIQDRVLLLREAFIKTNRLAMLWAIPFGAGLALFAPQLIHYVLGDKWRPATDLVQVYGVVAALNHVGFNWDDYYRARSETRPIAVFTVTGAAITLAAGIPLLLADGLPGLAVGIGIGASASLVVRAVYVARMFDGLSLFRHGCRALVPVLPAVAVVLALRQFGPAVVPLGFVLAEFAAYILIAGMASAYWERDLLLEAVAHLRGRAS